MNSGFQEALNYIRLTADSEARKGQIFERLMKRYFAVDPLYKERFSNVWLWSEWAASQPGFKGNDTGIDIVAEERDGGFCAIQCKCYAPGTRISKKDLDSFISASARDPFTARLVVDTGDEWGQNANKTIRGLRPSCTVLRFGDLADRPIDWPNLARDNPENLLFRQELFSLRPHQREAFNDVMHGFDEHNRGKLIMACGTGKTFTALRIAEELVGVGGRVLYLVPSISLLQQSMREWATQRSVLHCYIGICSDKRAGRYDEDASIQELEIPVTTNPATILKALQKTHPDLITVVFCTYHSLPIVERAQNCGAPLFDLVLCDEAHRTTGIERSDDETSPFVLVHDRRRIRAKKRLYMTATPRLYTEGARAKAARHNVEVFSMDNPETYGPEFHRLPFSRAIEQGLLSDYKVIVLTMSEEHVDATLQAHLASDGSEINITDTAKIVGCWRALQDPENKQGTGEPVRPLKRAIAFTNTILASKRLETYFDSVVRHAVELVPEKERLQAFYCETRHVDGQHHALDRKARIEWLKGIESPPEESGGDSATACRILTNARCLSEGIDVPALDAVLFMSPRNSHVDIVQAVGRAMRKAKGKDYGYIILPIAVPPDTDPAKVLDDNERFAVVWSILRALRSHDDRLDAEINKIDLNDAPTDRIIFSGGNGQADAESEDNGTSASRELQLRLFDLPADAFYAKIVERCGDRKYWENWAKDVAAIFSRLTLRIKNLLADSENATLQDWFDAFQEELRVSINDSIGHDNAIEIMAQHLITRPVFEAMFEHYDFAGSNPVARALDALRNDFAEFGLENEVRDMEGFYKSVRQRAQGIDNSDARQRVLMELYEKFFATALEKDADRLGIVYTPVEIVDFILNSADHVLREEFGRSLSDVGVHILDPFTGTGIFLVRLIRSGLIQNKDIVRKYHEELHANEIVLLAYYIAAIHIEEALHGRVGGEYEPFSGIVLTDTFNLHTDRAGFPRNWLPANSDRAERQQKLPIQVIVGNPPWSARQRSSADNNPNLDYPKLQQRIARTYATRSNSTSKNNLYDSYKMAIRWASDRIGDRGIVAFVTNGSWLDGNTDSGVRACLAEEFTSIYVVNLRGDQRTQGERSRREGGKIFGQGSRAPVAISILVKNPNTDQDCHIRYHDIGDYLNREKKLEILRAAKSIEGISSWHEISPDSHHDWISQRDPSFSQLYPIGSKDAKANKADDTVFRLYSNGYATGRDAYTYNFSYEACAENARKMVGDYQAALEEWRAGALDIDTIMRRHSLHIRWDQKLKHNLRRGKAISYTRDRIHVTQYRPFVKQHCYVEYTLAGNKSQQNKVFPLPPPPRISPSAPNTDNCVICISGRSSRQPFSVLIVDSMPDLNFMTAGAQCFPRYEYLQPEMVGKPQNDLLRRDAHLERIDNITDVALASFRLHYANDLISKDDIFNYVYGILHAPDWRERFASNLAKELPRIPFAKNFQIFSEAGHKLAILHLGYETCEEYPLRVVCRQDEDPGLGHFRIGERAMRFADDYATLIINEHIRLTGIPAEAREYLVNGRTPLEWLIDRYRVTRDKYSGILNDPNGWFDDPQDLIATIGRVVQVSVETACIIKRLPPALDEAGYQSKHTYNKKLNL